MTSLMYGHARHPATAPPLPLVSFLVELGSMSVPHLPHRPCPAAALLLPLPARQPPDPFHSSGRVGGVGRMAGCTSHHTPRLGGGARPSRIGLLDNRIALQYCQAGSAQSCPRRRTPQRTPQHSRLSGGGASWSTWTNPTLAARTPSLAHVDQGDPRRSAARNSRLARSRPRPSGCSWAHGRPRASGVRCRRAPVVAISVEPAAVRHGHPGHSQAQPSGARGRRLDRSRSRPPPPSRPPPRSRLPRRSQRRATASNSA